MKKDKSCAVMGNTADINRYILTHRDISHSSEKHHLLVSIPVNKAEEFPLISVIAGALKESI